MAVVRYKIKKLELAFTLLFSLRNPRKLRYIILPFLYIFFRQCNNVKRESLVFSPSCGHFLNTQIKTCLPTMRNYKKVSIVHMKCTQVIIIFFFLHRREWLYQNILSQVENNKCVFIHFMKFVFSKYSQSAYYSEGLSSQLYKEEMQKYKCKDEEYRLKN